MEKTPPDAAALTPKTLAAMIDHTFLKAAGAPDAVERLCAETVTFGFACAMVNPAEVATAAALLRGTGARIGAVIGFPLGQGSLRGDLAEAAAAIEDGAAELDFVINMRLLKAAAAGGGCGALAAGLREKAALVKAAGADAKSKLIIETCYLTDAEKVLACKLAQDAGFDFVKTSTGFGTGGATVADVRLMRETVGPAMGVKASGGIRDLDAALALVAAGANRLGCSAGVQIVEELAARAQRGQGE